MVYLMLGATEPKSRILLASDCLLDVVLVVEEVVGPDGVADEIVVEVDIDDAVATVGPVGVADCCPVPGVDNDGVMILGFVFVTVSFNPPPELPCLIAN